MLHTDRDYHLHFTGAIPKHLVERWDAKGLLPVDRLVTDLHKGKAGQKMTVREALLAYRGGRSLVDSYQAHYANIEEFLTMFPAFAEPDLCNEAVEEIAAAMYPEADVRVSVLDCKHLPFRRGSKDVISPVEWAQIALEDMAWYQRHFRPGQVAVTHFPRLNFTNTKNREYLAAYLSLMKGQAEVKPIFDFANYIRPVSETIEVLREVRAAFPEGTVLYHHGEYCDYIPMAQRIADGHLLAPIVSRIGHGICFGHPPPELREAADSVLRQFAERHVGIEVCPASNLTLGGAPDLAHVKHFLEMGVSVYAGTDDPGFLACTLAEERAKLEAALL